MLVKFPGPGATLPRIVQAGPLLLQAQAVAPRLKISPTLEQTQN